MVIVTHETYDSVLVGTGKQKGLESLSENCEWRRRRDVERQVVPDGGTRNRITYATEKQTAKNYMVLWKNYQPNSRLGHHFSLLHVTLLRSYVVPNLSCTQVHKPKRRSSVFNHVLIPDTGNAAIFKPRILRLCALRLLFCSHLFSTFNR